MTARRPLIVGNWKMHGRRADLDEARAIAAGLDPAGSVDVGLCPPLTLLAGLGEGCGALLLGAQDVSPEAADGPFTGEISASMLAEAGARLVIVGHSERRARHGETNALVAAKAMAALDVGLAPIVCVGETRADRDAGRAEAVVRAQVLESAPAVADPRLCLAYEPVWAIGAGVTPTLDEIEAVHRCARAALIERMGEAGRAARLLYGGSVKPANAAAIFASTEVDGALVGGASLKAAEFLEIIRRYPGAVR